ncbi:hypothetical protein ABI59_09755 [Acidobacteria bacterium Mor1]|nr:hypothetical protein ABI59_09755 [Acidobacteria bacterium Mor1]
MRTRRQTTLRPAAGLRIATLLLAASMFGQAAHALEWARFRAGCSGSGSTIEFSCGNFGTYHLGTIVPPQGCTAIRSGNEVPKTYAPGFDMDAAPFPTMPNFGPPSQKENSSGPWLAVLDFSEGFHGWSTAIAALQTALGGITTTLVPLEDAVDLGNEVTDVHLLAGLCSILDSVDHDGAQLYGVTMSLGRLLGAPPPPGTESLPQEIAGVIHQIRGTGATVTASAGNHDSMLFPAALHEVISVGMVDLHSLFLTGMSEPTWETPATAEALLPGSQLCLDQTFAAPSGSSYSTALLAGWFAWMRQHIPADPHDYTGWRAKPSETQSCWVLTNDAGLTFDQCNTGVDQMFQDYLSGLPVSCWPSLPQPTSVTVHKETGVDPPEIPSFDEWSSESPSPTPGGDPCVPCGGTLETSGGGGSDTLTIDMSQTDPLPEVDIHGVYINVPGGFFTVPLPSQTLIDIGNADLDQLVLTGYGFTNPINFQPSLWFEMGPANTDCSQAGTCFWTSTPILVTNNGN